MKKCLVVNGIAVLLILLIGAGSAVFAAGPLKLNMPAIPKAVLSGKAVPITVEIGDLEIVATSDDKNYWQVEVKNTSKFTAKNFKVYTVFEGFREQDRQQSVAVVDLIEPGRSAYARAEMPRFEGMHQVRIKAGGINKVQKIQRPFRRDANGNPAGALEIEKAWALKVDGKTRWYVKTKPNIYDIIPANALQFLITFRYRTNTFCHTEKNLGEQFVYYMDPDSPVGGPVVNPEIKSGEIITLSGELNEQTASPRLYDNIDRMYVGEGLNMRKLVVKLNKGFYPDYEECQY